MQGLRRRPQARQHQHQQRLSGEQQCMHQTPPPLHPLHCSPLHASQAGMARTCHTEVDCAFRKQLWGMRVLQHPGRTCCDGAQDGACNDDERNAGPG